MNEKIEYYDYFQLYNQPQEIVSNCNSFTLINTGAANAIIDGLTLAPGNQYVSNGNAGEYNVSRYRLSFSGAGSQQVLVIRKIYK